MRRLFSPIGVGLLLLAAACGRDVDVRPPSQLLPPTATLAPSVTVTPSPRSEVGSPSGEPITPIASPDPGEAGAGELTSLRHLSSSAAAVVDAAGYRVGVAVIDLNSGQVYAGGDDGRFPLASVAKLALAAGVLRRAELEERDLTWHEREQLGLMLSESKNGPAVQWWAELGGDAVIEALETYGVTGFQMPPDEQWGDMAASAIDVANLVRLVVDDQSPLRADDRAFVLSLMEAVVTDQRWGISAGVDLGGAAGSRLAIKNGWYPEDEIWRLNSAGAFVFDGSTDFVVVVLSDGSSDFYRGVRVIEEIAAEVNWSLYPSEVLVALPEFVPPPDDGSLVAVAPEDAVPEVSEVPVVDEPEAAEFVALRSVQDVLLPAGGELNSAESEESLAVWFEVESTDVTPLLDSYLASMRALGWSTVSGPPSLVLSKQSEGRFVAVTPLAGGPGGLQILEFRIAPAPDATVGSAAID